MKSRKKTIPIYWVTVGLILLFFNNIVAFLGNLGFTYLQSNGAILLVVTAAAYYFTPYLDAIVRGKR